MNYAKRSVSLICVGLSFVILTVSAACLSYISSSDGTHTENENRYVQTVGLDMCMPPDNEKGEEIRAKCTSVWDNVRNYTSMAQLSGNIFGILELSNVLTIDNSLIIFDNIKTYTVMRC